MAVSIKHAFTSLKGDGTDATLVQPSQWNAAHSTSMSTGNILGRQTAGTGVFEEIPTSAAVFAALNSADGLTFLANLGVGGFSTGDAKFTMKTVADAGWIMAGENITIGNVGSGATYALATTQALYTLLWQNISSPSVNVRCPVTGGLGASAAADWGAGKALSTGKYAGRALGVMGTGTGLTARALGEFLGEETHTTTSNEMPSHYHVAGIFDPGHTHQVASAYGSYGAGPLNQTLSAGSGAGFTSGRTLSSDTLVRVTSANGLNTTESAGGAQAHNNMQPTTFLNLMVKL